MAIGCVRYVYYVHPWSLTWNLRIQTWKRKIIFQTIIFRFYVKLRGCTYMYMSIKWYQCKYVYVHCIFQSESCQSNDDVHAIIIIYSKSIQTKRPRMIILCKKFISYYQLFWANHCFHRVSKNPKCCNIPPYLDSNFPGNGHKIRLND